VDCAVNGVVAQAMIEGKQYDFCLIDMRTLFFASRNSPLLQNIFPGTGGEN
jgi:hypothetical protein